MAQVLLDDERTGGLFDDRNPPDHVSAGPTQARPLDTSPDVSSLYRSILGRAPDARELESDSENLGKYGLAQLESNLRERKSSDPVQSGGTVSRGGGVGGGGLFSDQASSQLEGIAKAQMGEVRSNPGLDQLMAFLNSQFQQLSTTPGYSPQDLSLLNTQAFEPIEARRTADQRRVLERTAARGFLPSSGLTEELAQNVDTEANRQRTIAGRDLAVNAIGQRRADLDRAVQLGSLIGLDIPRSQRSEELNLSQLLYQMPRNALQDLLAVINGSPTSNDLFSQSLQAQNMSLQNQQQNDQRNAALMQQIGAILGTLFR